MCVVNCCCCKNVENIMGKKKERAYGDGEKKVRNAYNGE